MVGMIGEEIQKHRYARAVRKQFESLEPEMSQSQTPSRREEQPDILFATTQLPTKHSGRFKIRQSCVVQRRDSLVLAVGQIVSTLPWEQGICDSQEGTI